MKFATKIILGTWIIMALCFSLGSLYIVRNNFQFSYDSIIETKQRQHLINRYSLEADVRGKVEKEDDFSIGLVKKCVKKIEDYGQKDTGVILTEIKEKAENEIFYKNIGIDKKILNFIETGGAVHYEVYETDEKQYLLMASLIDFYGSKIKIVNRYDISAIFAERDRQLNTFMKADIIGMTIAFFLLFLLAHLLTRKIKKLSVVSSRIAEGSYGLRTEISGHDEIGELSRNFDRMADSIESHIRRLERDVKAREQFVSDFSHELKTPMTSMMGYSQLLLGNSLGWEEKEKALDYIYSECSRLQKLSNTLLKMLGILEETITKKWVYTEWIGEQIEKICLEEMKKSKLVIEVENKQIYTDVELVVTLIRNLVSNGDKACSTKESDEVKVLGKMEEASGKYLFFVTDTGVGMEPEEIAKITEPFYRIDKSRAGGEGGSGIGLAICSKICQFLDITMKIESVPGVGTTVCLAFPEAKGIENPKD